MKTEKKQKSTTTTEAIAAAKQIAAEPIVLGSVPKSTLCEVPLAAIQDPPGEPDRLPRSHDAERIAETARSLVEVGQLQPVMVEDLGAGAYQRVFGRRRIAAAKSIGRETIMALVVPPLAPDVRRTIVAVENIQRQDLTHAEEHLAVAELLELQAIDAALKVGGALPGTAGRTMTPDLAEDLREGRAGDERSRKQVAAICHDLLLDPRVRSRAVEIVAAMLAKTPTWVRDRMYVGRLGPKARALMLAEKLPITHAREIAKLSDETLREELAESYAAGGDCSISDTEPGSLDALQEEVSQKVYSLAVAPWRKDVQVAGMRACEGCPHNTLSMPGLFEHGGKVSTRIVSDAGVDRKQAGKAEEDHGVCTKHECFSKKLRECKAALSVAAKKVLDEGLPVTDRRVAKPFLEPKAIVAKAKDLEVKRKNMPLRPSGEGGAPKSREGDYGTPLYQARQVWKEKVEIAAGKREEVCLAAIGKDDVNAACLVLAHLHPAWLKSADEPDAKVTPTAMQLLHLVLGGDLAAIVKLVGKEARDWMKKQQWLDVRATLIQVVMQDTVAKHFSLYLPAMPGPKERAEIFGKYGYGPDEKLLDGAKKAKPKKAK